jgi:hypothetical protein
MTPGYRIDATDSARKKSTMRNKHLLLTPKKPAVVMMLGRSSP